jgi:hypothetical protein
MEEDGKRKGDAARVWRTLFSLPARQLIPSICLRNEEVALMALSHFGKEQTGHHHFAPCVSEIADIQVSFKPHFNSQIDGFTEVIPNGRRAHECHFRISYYLYCSAVFFLRLLLLSFKTLVPTVNARELALTLSTINS